MPANPIKNVNIKVQVKLAAFCAPVATLGNRSTISWSFRKFFNLSNKHIFWAYLYFQPTTCLLDIRKRVTYSSFIQSISKWWQLHFCIAHPKWPCPGDWSYHTYHNSRTSHRKLRHFGTTEDRHWWWMQSATRWLWNHLSCVWIRLWAQELNYLSLNPSTCRLPFGLHN